MSKKKPIKMEWNQDDRQDLSDMTKEEIDQDIWGRVRELSDTKEGELPDLSDFGIPIDKALTDENQNKDE